MSYLELPARIDSVDYNLAGDINQLNENIKIIAGNSPSAPTRTIQQIISTDLPTIEANVISKGEIIGGLVNQGVAIPKIGSGTYHVGSHMVKYTSDQTITTADLVGDKTLRANLWYHPCIDESGNKKIIMAHGSVITNTGVIASIAANVITISSLFPTGVAIGSIILLEGLTASGEDGYYSVTGTNGTTTITVAGGLTNQAGSGGTCKAYNRYSAIHLGGTNGNTAATTETYSPLSYATAPFNATLNGYYEAEMTAYTGYRKLGAFYYHGSSQVSHVLSYLSGRDRNDIRFFIQTYSSLLTNSMRFTTPTYLWSDAYTYTDDVTNGATVTINTPGFYNFSMTGLAPASAITQYIIKNTTVTAVNTEKALAQQYGVASQNISLTGGDYLNKGEYVRFYTSAAPSATAGVQKVRMVEVN